ncbi:hypothetical protein BaRGS_00003877, partial [Batillaria attramentaria]
HTTFLKPSPPIGVVSATQGLCHQGGGKGGGRAGVVRGRQHAISDKPPDNRGHASISPLWDRCNMGKLTTPREKGVQ